MPSTAFLLFLIVLMIVQVPKAPIAARSSSLLIISGKLALEKETPLKVNNRPAITNNIMPKALNAAFDPFSLYIIIVKAAIIILIPVRIPGIYPARKSAVIETPPLAKEYTIRILLGGIDNPVVAEAMLTAALKFSGYPSFFISGCIILPMADAEAAAEPEIAPKSIFPRTLTIATPPGIPPTNTRAKSINRMAIPPLFIIFPASIKNGIARSAKLSNPVAIR